MREPVVRINVVDRRSITLALAMQTGADVRTVSKWLTGLHINGPIDLALDRAATDLLIDEAVAGMRQDGPPTPDAPPQPTAARVAPGQLGMACERVSQELRAVTGRAWPSDAHVQAFGWIAQQPAADWVAVRAGIAADPWSQQYPSRVTPKHIVASWPKYLTPDPAGPVKTDVDVIGDARDARRKADIAAAAERIDRELAGDVSPSADEIRAMTAKIGRSIK